MNFLYAEPLWAHKESLVMTATRRALGEAPALVCVCQAGAASCSLAAAWEGHNCAVKKACVWLSQVLTAQTWRTGTWTCWTRLERSTLYPAATHKTGEAQIRESRWERERGGEGGEREQRETTEEDSSEKHRFYDFFLGTEYDLTGRALSVNKQDYKEIQRADWLFGKGGEIVRSSLVRIAQQMKSNWEKHNNMPPKPRGQSIRRRVLTGKLSKQMSANAYK